ncbi:MAG: hypothetical protein EPO39_16910 [Candidatus Manganitrophaceae bacterium]|nr:MAG: hypothetical protein EPO39_16910 [Candidatus Manganitrophaceae bacterium]
MKIDFTRSGGFAGMRSAVAIDTENLPSTESERLHRLVEEAGFFDLPAALKSTAPGGDRFQYRVKVEEGTRRKEIVADEAAVPERLRPLLDYLTGWARASQKRKTV